MKKITRTIVTGYVYKLTGAKINKEETLTKRASLRQMRQWREMGAERIDENVVEHTYSMSIADFMRYGKLEDA